MRANEEGLLDLQCLVFFVFVFLPGKLLKEATE